ncbi:uncharacterized protein LOC118418319 [Branchiostoma floridae]|uniref:Uncharacterized protein LOC118418319 n=1 Tax=Branchiostoma floridae TaxID=7739 RepID=A0A9J7LDM3_BRAFL|nr:uncharacterized protein LOC118418319 [Branchiostoma floridae]
MTRTWLMPGPREEEHVDLPDVPDLDDVMDLMMALDDIEVEVGGKTEDGDTVPWFGKVADAVTKRSQIKVQWYVITPDHSYKVETGGWELTCHTLTLAQRQS